MRSPPARPAGARARVCCSGVISSSLSPSSFRSSRAFSGSPSRFASGLPVAALESARLSDVSDAARCSLAGSTWARTSVSIAPSRARLASRSSGRSRSWRARSRSSWASLVRGSSGSAPLSSSSSATRSIFSAWRSAASRTCCCWAITASCGFGSRVTGTSRSGAHQRDRRGLAREARPEQARHGAMPIERTASRRCRRTNRSVSAASSSGPTSLGRRPRRLRPGRPSRERDGQFERAGDPVAEPTLGVDRQRRLADPGAGAHAGDQPAEEPDERDRRAEHRCALERARPGRTSTGRVRRRRPPQARSSRVGRADGPTAGGGRGAGRCAAGRVPGRAARRATASGIGRDDDRCLRPASAAGDGARRAGRHQASVLGAAGTRRSRQRRVGETNWTDSSEERDRQDEPGTTVFCQIARVDDPNGTASAADDHGVHGEPADADTTVRGDLQRAQLFDGDLIAGTGGPACSGVDPDHPARVRAVDEDDPVLARARTSRGTGSSSAAPSWSRTGVGRSHVGLGEERVEEDERCRRRALDRPGPAPPGPRSRAPARTGSRRASHAQREDTEDRDRRSPPGSA